jgi:pantoate--beta-alanine ligase
VDSVGCSERVGAQVRAWKAEGCRVGFVPTMGFLHRGHTSLMDLARSHCDRLVVSIFVNPLQFDDVTDLERYPIAPAADAEKCRAHGTDLLYVPSNFYPEGFSTAVSVGGLTERLCGATRPGHFDGVTTVVARLFGVVSPDVAVFGEKDYQQLQVIRSMVRDLGLAIEVLPGPLVRDEDGLALSSRNTRLSVKDRRRSLSLHQALLAMAQAVDRDVESLIALGKSILDVDRLDYLEVVDADTLLPLKEVEGKARGLVAAYVGETRLIDNVAL